MKIAIGDRLEIGDGEYVVTQVRVDTFLFGDSSSIMILANDVLTYTRQKMEDDQRKRCLVKTEKAADMVLEEGHDPH